MMVLCFIPCFLSDRKSRTPVGGVRHVKLGELVLEQIWGYVWTAELKSTDRILAQAAAVSRCSRVKRRVR